VLLVFLVEEPSTGDLAFYRSTTRRRFPEPGQPSDPLLKHGLAPSCDAPGEPAPASASCDPARWRPPTVAASPRRQAGRAARPGGRQPAQATAEGLRCRVRRGAVARCAGAAAGEPICRVGAVLEIQSRTCPSATARASLGMPRSAPYGTTSRKVPAAPSVPESSASSGPSACSSQAPSPRWPGKLSSPVCSTATRRPGHARSGPPPGAAARGCLGDQEPGQKRRSAGLQAAQERPGRRPLRGPHLLSPLRPGDSPHEIESFTTAPDGGGRPGCRPS
jgi:hypothetical protein